MKPLILYRKSEMEDEELTAAKSCFDCETSRVKIGSDQRVIARYCALPFYRELETDIENLGSQLINSYNQHLYVADLANYVVDLEDLTPKTWFSLYDTPRDAGPFVLKGATNSKKQLWTTHMYAETWQDAGTVYSNLQKDGLIQYQQICIRKYVKLVSLGTAIGGLPLTKEFRFFVYNGHILSGGFYWAAFKEDIVRQGHRVPSIDEVPVEFLNDAIARIGTKCPFYAIDVAQGDDGRWIVIELNDGQMSGLSDNNPLNLYQNLASRLSQ